MNFTRLERLILVIGISISMIVAAYAAVSKLSQIAASGANMASGDTVIGVTGGNTDLQFSRAQIANGVASALSSRTVLTADQSFFVNASTGNDSNNCTGSGTACLTIQGVINLIATSYDIGSAKYHVTVNLAAGTYAGNVVLPGYVGTDKGVVFHTVTNPGIEIKGDITTPANVIIQTDSTTSNALAPLGEGYASGALTGIDGMWSVRGVTFSKSGSNAVKYIASYYSSVITFDKVAFNANANGVAAYAQLGGYVSDDVGGSWTVAGSLHTAVWADVRGVLQISGAVTNSGTPTLSQAYLQAYGGQIFWQPASVTGAITGPRYDIEHQGSVTIFSPGSIAGIPGSGSTSFLDMRSRLASIPDNLFYGDIPGSVGSGTPTVASLLGAATVSVGFYSWVADANATTVGSTVAGGGSNHALVISDGANWKILGAY